MKVPQNIRNKRIEEIQNLYNKVFNNSDKYSEQIYKIIHSSNKTKNEKKQNIKDLIWKSLEETISIVLKEAKQMYPNAFDENISLNIEDILYQEDKKLFPERIDEWYEQDLSEERLTYQMLLIHNTETLWIIPRALKAKLTKSKIYIEIIYGGGPDNDVNCMEYVDGEAHPEDEIELPPYHPNCSCEPVYYETEDLKQIIEDKI